MKRVALYDLQRLDVADARDIVDGDDGIVRLLGQLLTPPLSESSATLTTDQVDRAAVVVAGFDVQRLDAQRIVVTPGVAACYIVDADDDLVWGHLTATASTQAKTIVMAGAAAEVRRLEDERAAAVTSAMSMLTMMMPGLAPARAVFDADAGLGITDDAGPRFGAKALSEAQRLLVGEAVARLRCAYADAPRVVLLEVDSLDDERLAQLQQQIEGDVAIGEVAFAVLATCHAPPPRQGWETVSTVPDPLAVEFGPEPVPPVQPRREFSVPANPHRLLGVINKLALVDQRALLDGAVTPVLAAEGFVTGTCLNAAAADAAALLRGEEVRGVRRRAVAPSPRGGATVSELGRLLAAQTIPRLTRLSAVHRIGGGASDEKPALKANLVDIIATHWHRQGMSLADAVAAIEDVRAIDD